MVPELASFFEARGRQYARSGFPQPPFLGTLADAFSRPLSVVGPRGARQSAAFLATQPWAKPGDTPTRGRVLWGTPRRHTELSGLLQASGWVVGPDRVRVAGTAVRGNGLVLVAVRPDRSTPSNPVVIIASDDERNLTGCEDLELSDADWAILRRLRGKCTSLKRGRFAKRFDGGWRFDAAE